MTITLLMFLLVTTDGVAEDALTEREKAQHVLNRLAFGPRPGEVDAVAELGVDRWIARQLNPSAIDDSAVVKKIEALETLSMSPEALFEKFEKPHLERRREARRETASGEPDSGMMAEARSRMTRNPASDDSRQKPLFELMAAKLIRSVESERQLEEVLVDFWMNHFNVFAAKGPERALLPSFEYDVVRPNVWGSYEDLVLATAKSPAMLVYLDNMRSVSEPDNRPETMTRSRWPSATNRRRGLGAQVEDRLAKAGMTGLNENYARELMELHTLGVEGGYAQEDVTELARILTGWSAERPEAGGEFVFRSSLHDVESKIFLGVPFPGGGGIQEGERAIAMLASHPSTARHIARKLCQRFVADDPPAQLVDRVADVFLRTKGNLRSTVEAIVTSPEFFSPKSYRSKIKTPFEFVVSAVRAVDGETDGRFLARSLRDMGMPPYLCQPPTGYSDVSEDWVSSAAFLDRVNFSIALAAGSTPGTKAGLDSRSFEMSPDLIDVIATATMGGGVSDATRTTIETRIADEKLDRRRQAQLIAGLVLGSPEFQRQ